MNARRKLPYALSIALCLCVLFGPLAWTWFGALSKPYFEGEFYYDLSGLPVSMGGRVMPISSASADLLKIARGKGSFKDSSGRRVGPTEWIWRLNADFEDFANTPILRTDSRDLQKLFGAQGRYLSSAQLDAKHDDLLNVAQTDSPAGKAAAELFYAAVSYGLAGATLGFSYADSSAHGFIEEWFASVDLARGELEKSRAENREADRAKLSAAAQSLKVLREAHGIEEAYKNYLVRVVPSSKDGGGEWLTSVGALLQRDLDAPQRKAMELYAHLLADLKARDELSARARVSELKGVLKNSGRGAYAKCGFENFLNILNPFFTGLPLYGIGAVLLLFSLLARPRAAEILFGCAAVFILFALLAHTFGIAGRVYIQMRPPVTNLYSSIVFVGWGAALAAFWMSLRGRNFICAFSAAFAGFVSLLIALNMPHSGDTMGMMRAVLNSNFWLSAHVLTIVVGYCGIFLAGFMAAMRLLVYGVGRVSFTKGNSEEILKNVYAVLCFGLLFSFAGTMLGGIWADMSWGRFWGWDPKENGALMIILWSAAALHCRHLHLVSSRTFLAMCVFGNVVAAWAWFGVNMLGIGLHSYGFFSGGWLWFCVFALSQIVIALMAFLPMREKSPASDGGKSLPGKRF